MGLNLYVLWEFLDEILWLINIGSDKFSFVKNREMYDFDLVNTRGSVADTKLILYLNTIVNHNIWRYRNKIQHEGKHFEVLELIQNVVKSLYGRKSYDSRLKSNSEIDGLARLCIEANFVKNAYDELFGAG